MRQNFQNHAFIRGMWIEPGAISKIKNIMNQEGWQEPVIICDQNTYFLGDSLLEAMDNYDLICLDPDGWPPMSAAFLWPKIKFPRPRTA